MPAAQPRQTSRPISRLIIQRAVEDEFDACLGRARYERPAGVSARVAQL
jgi:hypothetical protein